MKAALQDHNMGRMVMVMPLAIVATGLVFMIMQGLIKVDQVLPELEVELPRIVIFHQPEVETASRRELPARPTDTALPPERPTPEDVSPENPGPSGVGGGVITLPTPRGDSGNSLETLHLPSGGQLVRIPPQYPAILATRGVEGQCSVTFDILASGGTANIRVTACDHSGFERATVRAVEQWKYQSNPNLSAQTVISQESTTLVFELQD